ncbi:MAG: hypothetical protein PVJ72_09660 [Gammaproteobacteria bacterium]|jgi:hypothetical protein
MQMFKKYSGFAILLMAGVVYSTQAMAVGNGFYVQLGSGNADWTEEDYFNQWYFNSDTSHFGAGFVVDTAAGTNHLFNYRLQLGYEKYTDTVQNSTAELQFDSFIIDQDFGFAMVRNNAYRFWLGPELRIAFLGESSEGYDTSLFGVGLGPAVGIDFHTGPNVSMGFKGSYLMMSYDGVALDNWYGNDIDYRVNEDLVFFNFTVLFH